MSRMARELAQHRPDWTAVAERLERAWAWMEEQGHGRDAAAGYVLSPYPEDRIGAAPAFVAGLSLDGWLDEGAPGYARLLPIAEASGDGSLVALWADDQDRIRIVVLDSDGAGYGIAEDDAELLTLLAVGYDEITAMTLGDPPDEPLPLESLAPLRAWVQNEFGAELPEEWRAVGDDEFSAWLDRQLGREATAVAAPDGSTAVTGDVVALLSILGEPDGAEVAARVQGLIGRDLPKGQLRSSGAALRKAGIEVESDRHGISTIWIRTTERATGPIVKVAAPAYPNPAALIEGLDDGSTREETLALLGEPEKQGPTYVRYAVDGRYLHLQFDDGLLARITLMVTAP
ncbi:hypothetical protein [Microbacterium sp. W4I20]|uniref:hypothetical protein n=1 Tax=Microbacterium sp. W4I20 TaxID=3042262 RepID=UPI0027821579|nr:hypothetical protein [Microbacterium sp. W4I20]MDQ0727405.1 hypothetical protein [Microbacterium sp. W4I20]